VTVRLLWRTDVHLSDVSPASRKDDWTESVFDKLDQVKEVARRARVHGLIDGGDFFHLKSPSRTTHRLVQRVAMHHADYPCPVYCTPGNHDAVYGNYEYLPQQPLGVLYAAGLFGRLYDEHEARFESDGVRVRVVGVPYHGTSYDLERFASIKRGDEDHLVCVAHVLASERGGTMFENEDVLRYSELAEFAPNLYLIGHWHNDQGVAEIDDTKIVNTGAMTRGSIAQDDVDRRPAIALLTFTKEAVKVQVARLRVQAAEEVFDLDAHVRAEARATTMDAFVSSVRETLVEREGESLEDCVKASELPEIVRERAIAYLEAAG
jgi:DNA repair exonuclease SbcCD nuclease subunit